MAAPIAATLASVAALLLCVAGSPWHQSVWAGLAVTVVSAVPLGVLTWLVWRARGRAAGLERAVRHDEAELGHLAHQGERLRAWLREARSAAVGGAAALAPSEASMGEGARGGASVAGPCSLVRAALDYMSRRFAGGETVRGDALRQFLGERSLDLLTPLQRAHEAAFSVGLGGTVLGLGVQTFLAQQLARGALLDNTFLTGVVLKASTTCVGLLVAVHARALRFRLMARHDQLIDDLDRGLGLHLAPMSTGAAESGDAARAGREAAEQLERTMRGASAALVRSVRAALRGMREEIERALTGALADSLATQVTTPFTREMATLRDAVRDAGATVGGASEGLARAADLVRIELALAMRAAGGFLERLQESRDVMADIRGEFDAVLRTASQAASLLERLRGELELSVEQARRSDGPWGADTQVAGEVIRAAEALRDGQRSVTEALHQLVRLQGDDAPRGRQALRLAPPR